MIHIGTVHFRFDYWIDLQLKYLKRFVNAPYKAYAFLTEIENDHRSRFDYATNEWVREHDTKLNLLADIMCFNAKDEDYIVFIDGDAFPIQPLFPYLEEKIKKHKLVAVQRLENHGDIQPHPCFCATTVGFWKEIQGDWHKGYYWKNSFGQNVTDTGALMLQKVIEHNIDWYPMVRSNRINLHPLLFGVYDNLVYHHGAGFRDAVLRVDNPFRNPNREVNKIMRLLEMLPDKWGGSRIKRNFHRDYKQLDIIKKRNGKLIEDFMEKINKNEDFYKELIDL